MNAIRGFIEPSVAIKRKKIWMGIVGDDGDDDKDGGTSMEM